MPWSPEVSLQGEEMGLNPWENLGKLSCLGTETSNCTRAEDTMRMGSKKIILEKINLLSYHWFKC